MNIKPRYLSIYEWNSINTNITPFWCNILVYELSSFSFQGSKVENEIMRFQREIEKSANERSRIQNWEKRKSSRSHNCSMDSLLSFDSDASSNYNLNFKSPTKGGVTGLKMPPKGKYSSTTSLLTNVQKQIMMKNEECRLDGNTPRLRSSSPPPILPQKEYNGSFKLAFLANKFEESKKSNTKEKSNNVVKRRVSISTDAVEIIGEKTTGEKTICHPVPDADVKENLVKDVGVMTTKRNPLYDRNDNKRFDEQQKNNKRMSVPDLIPSHELNNVAHMRIQNNEIQKTGLPAKSTNLLMDHRIPKRKSLHASNKDIADLAEKGLPSVRDLVNKFIPYRTGSVNLHRSPEPKPRHSLSQKVM